VPEEAPNEFLYARRGGVTAAERGRWVMIPDPAQIGAWQDFEVFTGWTNSTLRHRIFDGHSVQFDWRSIGLARGQCLAQLGVLAPEFRPRASKLLVAAVMGGALTYGFAQIQV